MTEQLELGSWCQSCQSLFHSMTSQTPFRAKSGHHLSTMSLALYVGPNHTCTTLSQYNNGGSEASSALSTILPFLLLICLCLFSYACAAHI